MRIQKIKITKSPATNGLLGVDSSMKTITIHETVHRGKQRYKLEFPYNMKLTEKVRTIPGRQWSRTMKCRHIPPDTELLKDFQWQFPDGMYSANGPKAKKSHLNQPQDKTVNCKHNQPEQTTPPQQSSAGKSMNDIVGGYKQSLLMKQSLTDLIVKYGPLVEYPRN